MAEKILLTDYMVQLFCKNVGLELDSAIVTVACKFLSGRTYTEEELVDSTLSILTKYQEDYPDLEQIADLEIVKSSWKVVKDMLTIKKKYYKMQDRM